MRRLDKSIMKSDIDPGVFLSEVFQLRYELNDFEEAITTEHLTTIPLGALPEEMYFTVKMQSIRDFELGLGGIIDMMKTVFRNQSERWSARKMSQESYRKVRNSGREPKSDNVRESAMTLTCHNCKETGHKKKYCKELMGLSDKPSHVKNGTTKWCSYHHSNEHPNENC